MRRFLVALNCLALAVALVVVCINPPLGWLMAVGPGIALWIASSDAGNRLDNHNPEE